MSHDLRDVFRSQGRESLDHTEGEEKDGVFLLSVSSGDFQWLDNIALEFLSSKEAQDPRSVCSPDDRCGIRLPVQLLVRQELVNILEKGSAFITQIHSLQVV